MKMKENYSVSNKEMKNQPLSREEELADLDFQLSELAHTRFNAKKRKEIEQHRRQLIKAQHDEEREKIKLTRQLRREEEKQLKLQQKFTDAETANKINQERQRDALAKDRRRRARLRKFDRIFDFVGKIIFIIFLILGILSISNQAIRDRVAITFNNLFDLVEILTDNNPSSSNKTVDELSGSEPNGYSTSEE